MCGMDWYLKLALPAMISVTAYKSRYLLGYPVRLLPTQTELFKFAKG
jgi:hypothetical protein